MLFVIRRCISSVDMAEAHGSNDFPQEVFTDIIFRANEEGKIKEVVLLSLVSKDFFLAAKKIKKTTNFILKL